MQHLRHFSAFFSTAGRHQVVFSFPSDVSSPIASARSKSATQVTDVTFEQYVLVTILQVYSEF